MMPLDVKAWELTLAEYDALPWGSETYLNPAIVAKAQNAKSIREVVTWLNSKCAFQLARELEQAAARPEPPSLRKLAPAPS